jgi:hypothetical protein
MMTKANNNKPNHPIDFSASSDADGVRRRRRVENKE